MVSIKAKKGEILTTALKVDPGTGAVDFAMRYVEELTLNHVEELVEDLVNGNFEEIDDKKVRRCQFCGYYYRDVTKNNSSLTCSDDCKTGKDIVLKAYRRKLESEGKPKRLSYEDLYYAQGLEYPFWANEFHMFESDRKNGAYSYGDNFEEVVARDLMNAKMGGKKKAAQIIDYDGYDNVVPFAVDLSEKLRKTTEMKTIKRSASEIEDDLLARYGAEKLEVERKRAQMFERRHYY
ncbi:hypothetical protein [Paenisporosarcina sp. NPDC076898]|uniref:hypothetical protein n=1 Tax=unclassified Paenisporosarcina TaxID=2642018 RepID=UPI003D061DBA